MITETEEGAYQALAIAVLQSAVFDLPRRFKWSAYHQGFRECNRPDRVTARLFFKHGYFHIWADIIRASYDILMAVYEERKDWVLYMDRETKEWHPYQEEKHEDEQLDNLVCLAHSRRDSGDVVIQHRSRAAAEAYRREGPENKAAGGWNRRIEGGVKASSL